MRARPTDRPPIYPADIVVMAIVPVLDQENQPHQHPALHFFGWHRDHVPENPNSKPKPVRALLLGGYRRALPYLGCRNESIPDILIHLYKVCSSKELDSEDLLWRDNEGGITPVASVFNDGTNFHFFFPTQKIIDPYEDQRWRVWCDWGDSQNFFPDNKAMP